MICQQSFYWPELSKLVLQYMHNMTSFQERFSVSKVKKYIPLFVVGKLAIFTGFLLYMMQG
ncbi:hypothetical protein DNJ73_02210 [Prochlorococcus marinus XMU1408]|uniref:Uncharacterized protein n=1 Tax=Prochlorococcus marinus XMU1408 TaxID=2213228 RepID=A0A318R3S6_PROMR|nr:hypothetical protein DNJ73_02210 [Prochlorococcus marinus XMU1408]